MVIDGVSQRISYSDLHTANLSTRARPTEHVLGDQVPVVIVDTEIVTQGVYPRRILDDTLDNMLRDFELQCNVAQHQSWHFFGELISRHFNRFFKENGDKDLDEAKQICLDRFQRLWRDIRFRRR